MKHDELQHSLAVHLLAGTDRMVWENTQLGPAGSPRPDVFTVNTSFSRFRTDAYECKVSLSDLRGDVTSGKWQSYRRFAHAVWFAFPRGMAPLDLVPRECGVILLGDSGNWRAARKPVAQVHDHLPTDMWLKLVMEMHSRAVVRASRDPVPRAHNAWSMERLARKKAGDELGQMLANTVQAERQLRLRQAEAQAAMASLAEAAEERRRQLARDAARDSAVLDEGMRALATDLGLPPGPVLARDLTRAIAKLRSLVGDWRIDAAIKSLGELQAVLRPAAAQAANDGRNLDDAA